MTNDDNKMGIKEVRSCISEIISRMSEDESRKLLKGLEKWQQSKPHDKRKHHRKYASIYAICETKNCNFRDFTKNISAGGVFIETDTTLSVNEDVFMTLLHSSFEVPIRTSGQIVRVDPKGIGVKFKNTINSI
ncbi:MAG: PilZ domain-containing protein [Desulfobacterales bacterium]|nr:PilZ domain-containing protein [Desulfobacterales bacterium]